MRHLGLYLWLFVGVVSSLCSRSSTRPTTGEFSAKEFFNSHASLTLADHHENFRMA